MGDSGVEVLSAGLNMLGCLVREEGSAALGSKRFSRSYSSLEDAERFSRSYSSLEDAEDAETLLYPVLAARRETSRFGYGRRRRFGSGQTMRYAGKFTPEPHTSAKYSSDWTELEPAVNTVNDVQTYSLQSGAGHFECSVSALRWVCEEEVSFKYQFCSWDKHREKPSCQDYMPAGPLLDITVTAGKMKEAHLPHWICVGQVGAPPFVDRRSNISDMFAVLHVDTCGDVVEKASEVTSSHVKLLQPDFSPRGVMILKRLGFSVRVFYDVLIYKTIKAALTLHVYLLPPDPVLQEAVEREEKSDGSKRIRKPSPDKSLLMENRVFLSTDLDSAEICPDELRLTSERRNPNFFEVFIRNAQSDFSLKLEGEQKRRKDTVWSCTIRTAAGQQHFVDRHQKALINRVRDTGAVLAELKGRGLISDEAYDTVRALPTSQEQMRVILRSVTSAGEGGKDVLYETLKGMKHLRSFIAELEGAR